MDLSQPRNKCRLWLMGFRSCPSLGSLSLWSIVHRKSMALRSTSPLGLNQWARCLRGRFTSLPTTSLPMGMLFLPFSMRHSIVVQRCDLTGYTAFDWPNVRQISFRVRRFGGNRMRGIHSLFCALLSLPPVHSNMLDSPRWKLWRDVNWSADVLTIRATAQNADDFTSGIDLAVMPVRFTDTPHRLDQMQRQKDAPHYAGPVAFNRSSVPMTVW